jgi:hypothetical protein
MNELDMWFPRDEYGRPVLDSPTQEEEPIVAQKAQGGREIGHKGEAWTIRTMLSLMMVHLVKRNDAPIQLPNGRILRPGASQIDMYGYGKIHGSSLAIYYEVEVKTFRDSYSLSSLHEQQMIQLDLAVRSGAMTILSLVEHDGKSIMRGFLIPWPQEGRTNFWKFGDMEFSAHNYNWVLERLAGKTSGNYLGRSIRQQDTDMLDEFLVEKSGNRWNLSTNHWARKMFGAYQLGLDI